MSLVKFSLEISATYKSICVKIAHEQQELMSNKCAKSRYAAFTENKVMLIWTSELTSKPFALVSTSIENRV